MAKKDRDKTKTIKQRAIYVYLPSLEMAQDWKDRSKKAGTSISKYVVERARVDIVAVKWDEELEMVGFE